MYLINYLNLPIDSKTQPTVPSPPQQITLKWGTSLNIFRPCIGPPWLAPTKIHTLVKLKFW